VSAKKITPEGVIARLIALAPEREIFLRTGGKLRFIRISSRFQLIAAAIAVVVALLWSIGTLTMLSSQASMLLERGHIAKDRAEISSREAKVEAYRGSVDDLVRDIEQRQKALDEILRENLGAGLEGGGASPVGEPEANAGSPASKAAGVASPEVAKLEMLRRHQTGLEARLADAAEARLTEVERAIRSFGLDPGRMIGRTRGQGGPYVPVSASVEGQPQLREIAVLLGRLNALESALAAIPSGKPTAAPMTTSSYGYRRDPFHGRLAYHAGMDFRGRHGQPILAAAAGKVKSVGVRQGYGNAVEIDHGKGLSTLYAHLSGFTVKPGQVIARGAQIGKMGSTGRSTGTHLHFEVHVGGSPVNPRPFLEVRSDVLEVQQTAKQRVAESSKQG
jgi:murein DD-endopeptidase MepM/ murein hydrolase activator NlpD